MTNFITEQNITFKKLYEDSYHVLVNGVTVGYIDESHNIYYLYSVEDFNDGALAIGTFKHCQKRVIELWA